MHRLGASKHGGQRLVGGPHNVHQGLLGGKRTTRRLDVEPELSALRACGFVSLGHNLIPDPAGRPVLGDFLEEILVGRQVKGKPGDKILQVPASS